LQGLAAAAGGVEQWGAQKRDKNKTKFKGIICPEKKAKTSPAQQRTIVWGGKARTTRFEG